MDLRNCDCMELMREFPDKYFDLAIVDPPYGIGISSNPVRQLHSKKAWDNSIPNESYFSELFRVSKNQIIWGGNYFNLPPTQCFFIWNKLQPYNFSLAMCEFAWSSFNSPAKLFTQSVHLDKGKIHPTQKPLELYMWLLSGYAKEGDKILDTHLGSGSITIACHDLGFDLTGSELDADYFTAMQERIARHTAQGNLFKPQIVTEEDVRQHDLFLHPAAEPSA